MTDGTKILTKFSIAPDESFRGRTVGREAPGPFGYHEAAIFVQDSEWAEFVETVMRANALVPERIRWMEAPR